MELRGRETSIRDHMCHLAAKGRLILQRRRTTTRRWTAVAEREALLTAHKHTENSRCLMLIRRNRLHLDLDDGGSFDVASLITLAIPIATGEL